MYIITMRPENDYNFDKTVRTFFEISPPFSYAIKGTVIVSAARVIGR